LRLPFLNKMPAIAHMLPPCFDGTAGQDLIHGHGSTVLLLACANRQLRCEWLDACRLNLPARARPWGIGHSGQLSAVLDPASQKIEKRQ
jgi:hypothetical protein